MIGSRRRAIGVLLLLGVLLGPAGVGITEDAETVSTDPRQIVEAHLEGGLELLKQGAFAQAREEFSAVLEIDPTHSEAQRLMTKAHKALVAEGKRAERAKERMRERAQELAIKFAREKAKELKERKAQAQAQLVRARESQIKYLYNRGQNLYRQGAYQAAIDTLQQMVLLDPSHRLIRPAQRLITRSETRLAEARARASAKGWIAGGKVPVSELEQQLAAKRIEVETIFKHATTAINERNYDLTVELLQRVLALDPRNRDAQRLLERAQTKKLEEDKDRLTRLVEQDERKMINEVLEAQRLPKVGEARLKAPAVTRAANEAVSQKLQVPISVNFEDVALGDVLEFIADAANVSIIPSPQLDLGARRVSLNVTELPLELAVRYLAKSQSLAYRVEQDVILIATPEEFASEPLETQVFFLRSGLGPLALETAAVEANPMLAMEPLKSLIEQAIPQPAESKFVIDERSGAIIATNTKENLALIERLLEQLDVSPVQVLIEARFVELNMTELEHMGFESVLTGNFALQKKGDDDGTQGAGHQLNSGSGFKFPSLSREDEGLNLTLEGILTGTQFEAVLHMLEESSKSKTLSAPRVTTLNNQTALIRVVDEFRYPTRYEVSLVQFDINGDGDFDDAAETEFVNVPQDFQKRDVGILLSVTPSIGRDEKTITLVLAPEVSQFSQFRDLGGGVTVPEFTTSQITTSVRIKSGETAVLGGLMKDTTSETVTKVPWLGDLPIVGKLFRQRSESSTRKNLLIFITARVFGIEGELT